MGRFVVRGIGADDAAENLLRQVDQHDKMLHQRALDRQDAAVEKCGPGRPRKLSSIGLLLVRDPAASPSTPPPPSRTGRSHENWWHPASIRPILQAVPACGGYSPAVEHMKLTQPETYNKLRESTVLDTAINRPFKHHTKQSFILDSVQQTTSQLDACTAAKDDQLDLSGKYAKPLSLMRAVAAHQHITGLSDLVLGGYKNADTLRAFDDSYQRAAMTEMGRLFEMPLLVPLLKLPQLLVVFEDEQNADAVEDDAAVQASDPSSGGWPHQVSHKGACLGQGCGMGDCYGTQV